MLSFGASINLSHLNKGSPTKGWSQATFSLQTSCTRILKATVMGDVALTTIVGVSLLCSYCITSPLYALCAIVSHVVDDVTE